jgi:hypothetical protein
MNCFCEIDYNLLTSIIALLVAVFALIVSYVAIRYQIISLINAQLGDKAKECNGNLSPLDLSKPPRTNDKVSGLLSSIITAEELLNYQVYHKKNIFLWRLDLQSLIDQFYLQLHTTIRVFIEKANIEAGDLDSTNHLAAFQTQFNRSRSFLTLSIKKSVDKEFEVLQKCTEERNRKNNSI